MKNKTLLSMLEALRKEVQRRHDNHRRDAERWHEEIKNCKVVDCPDHDDLRQMIAERLSLMDELDEIGIIISSLITEVRGQLLTGGEYTELGTTRCDAKNFHALEGVYKKLKFFAEKHQFDCNCKGCLKSRGGVQVLYKRTPLGDKIVRKLEEDEAGKP